MRLTLPFALPRPRRYGSAARFYDVLSLERPVYRVGRISGVAALRLEPEDWVLDVGCGTGLNFPLLVQAVGPAGRVIGVDTSSAMLGRARRRIAVQGWSNVHLHQSDAADLEAVLATDDQFDGVIFSYSLSIISDWRTAFNVAEQRLSPQGRIVVVDMALPTGQWRVFSPLARLACWAGGADPKRKPWQQVRLTMSDTSHETLRGGHIHVAAGSRPLRRHTGTDTDEEEGRR